MKFCLQTKIIEPLSGNKPKNAIILLHGYGGDGNDISVLANYWKRFLPNTIFFCPNGLEKCSVNSSGYQWFDLSKNDNNYIIKEALKAEYKINQFLNEIKNKYSLDSKNISLSGFSQGCMIGLNVALKLEEKISCLVGFSGRIIDKSNLIDKIKSRPNIFLLHGDKDVVVPVTNLLESKEFFLRANYKIKTKILKNCEHFIPVEASSLALEFLKKNLYQ